MGTVDGATVVSSRRRGDDTAATATTVASKSCSRLTTPLATTDEQREYSDGHLTRGEGYVNMAAFNMMSERVALLETQMLSLLANFKAGPPPFISNNKDMRSSVHEDAGRVNSNVVRGSGGGGSDGDIAIAATACPEPTAESLSFHAPPPALRADAPTLQPAAAALKRSGCIRLRGAHDPEVCRAAAMFVTGRLEELRLAAVSDDHRGSSRSVVYKFDETSPQF